MANRSFRIRPVWDPEAGVFYSEGDIVGLHIEAGSFEAFQQLVMELGPELIIANHLSDEELASTPLRDLVPAILIERPLAKAS